MSESFGDMFEKDLREHPKEFEIRRAEKTKKYWTPTAQRARRILEEHQQFARAEDEYTIFQIRQAVENGWRILKSKQLWFLLEQTKTQSPLTEKKYPIIVRPLDQYSTIRTSPLFNKTHLQYIMTMKRALDTVDKILLDIETRPDIENIRLKNLEFIDARDEIIRMRKNTSPTLNIEYKLGTLEWQRKLEDLHELYEFISALYAAYWDFQEWFIEHISPFLKQESSLTHDEKMKIFTYILRNS